MDLRKANKSKVITIRPQVPTFISDLRLCNNEVKGVLFKHCVHSLTLAGKPEFIPKEEAFMKAVFLDEKGQERKASTLVRVYGPDLMYGHFKL